ncbi:MAG TPA: flagellar biosynthesis protein FlhA [Candidatus Nanopelagicaceae bacterium]|nr:flagellar biosynthesis protein FlhA [Candidatus Nanopelagicaceae bacterium]
MGANRLGQFALPAAVVAVVFMMIVPLPTVIIDLLIACNITGALLVLLVSMFVKRPLDFAVFPALLLIATLFRLALNVSVTRRVLLDGFAGKVVESFGHFVIGGSLVVGLVIFLILIIIQFVVITNGAGRVAEVGARFTLDAMPGKQMAIDADLNSGHINEEEARRRRAEVTAEADFYGAMDGGSKFVKGDAVAAIVITVVNLVGGLLVGILQKHLSIGDAIHTYSLLTVGDGLVSQIPALMLSVATGLIVTRATASSDMGTDVFQQLSAQHRALRFGGIGVLALCVIPGIPKLPFLLVGGTVVLLSTRLAAQEEERIKNELPAIEAATSSPDSAESLIDEMRVDPIELEVAYDVVDLVDPSGGGDLLNRVKALRRKLALEIGLVLPPVRTRDDLDLPLSTYRIRLHGVEVARGSAPPGCVLAIGDGLDGLPGKFTQEPVFGLLAKWVGAELQHQAELSGATVVDRASVVTTHLSEVVRENASQLLGREDVRQLSEAMRRRNPVVVEDLTPALLTLGEIQRVLQSLLDERVPIRDLVRIFEALSQQARTGPDHERLVEAARATVGPSICATYAVNDGLSVLTLDPMLEQRLVESVRPGDQGSNLHMDTQALQSMIAETTRLVRGAEQGGGIPVLVCASQIRPALRRLLRGELPRLPVLSYSELRGPLEIRTLGVVNLVHEAIA